MAVGEALCKRYFSEGRVVFYTGVTFTSWLNTDRTVPCMANRIVRFFGHIVGLD